MSDTYSALTIARCSDCDVPLAWQLAGDLDGLCSLCDRLRTRDAIRRHLDDSLRAAKRITATVTVQHYPSPEPDGPAFGGPRWTETLNRLRERMRRCSGPCDCLTTPDDTPGVGAFPPRSAGRPEGIGSVPFLSPRRATTHHARERDDAAGGAL